MDQNWCTIESDPAVFSELIELFGVKDVEVEEIYSMDATEQKLGTSYGLIFLFKWRQEVDPRPILSASDVPDLFFAKQVITNACATQAILSVLLNAEGITLGETLASFKDFTGDFDAESKGLAISNSDTIRAAHNSFASADPFIIEESKHASEKGDAYHFVAYIPFNGTVYELDGLKRGPVSLGQIVAGEDWWTVARPAIEERMARYSATETHFALLTICQSNKTVIENKISTNESHITAVVNAIESGNNMGIVLNDGFLIEDSPEKLLQQKITIEDELEELRHSLVQHEENIKAQREENARRKHNFVPFIVILLKKLAEKQALEGLVSRAKETFSVRRNNHH